jgi:hypothetical protein
MIPAANTPEPVPVTFETPIPVQIDPATLPKPRTPGVQNQAQDPSIAAKTTFQEDLTTAGQRRVNLIWEYTQSFVTLLVVATNMVVAGVNAISGTGVVREHPVILSSSLFLILGFYYSRTNHAAIGGTGSKPEAKYEGR